MNAGKPTIRTRPVPTCLACGSPGMLLYEGLTDRSWAAPGVWAIRRCKDPHCGLAWLDPQPIEDDISLAYHGYYTHNQPQPGPSVLRNVLYAVWDGYLATRFGYSQGTGPRWRKALAPFAMLHPGGRDELDAAAMHLPAPKPGARVLDVGCGSGVVLERMKRLGWEVEGVEVDPEAVAEGTRRGVPVKLGTLEQQKYAEASFDAVHSAHVIEHVYDPASLLRECHRVLKPGGRLVVLTPNMSSLGHRRYGKAWLNLDPPRHLVLFNPAVLRTMAVRAGFQVQALDTSVRTAWVYGALSECIQRTGRAEMAELGKPANLGKGIAFQLKERLALRSDKEAGDELRLFAVK